MGSVDETCPFALTNKQIWKSKFIVHPYFSSVRLLENILAVSLDSVIVQNQKTNFEETSVVCSSEGKQSRTD